MKKLSLDEKINLLTTIRMNIRNTRGMCFLCDEFQEAALKLNFIDFYRECEPNELISEFTSNNAAIICKKHKIIIPDGDYVWWNIKDVNGITDKKKMNSVRVKFLTALIKEIKLNNN